MKIYENRSNWTKIYETEEKRTTTDRYVKRRTKVYKNVRK